jgi:hypothetical protein
MTRLHATAPHEIPDRPPIQVVPGQQVQVGQRDTEWPAFVFITTGKDSGIGNGYRSEATLVGGVAQSAAAAYIPRRGSL